MAGALERERALVLAMEWQPAEERLQVLAMELEWLSELALEGQVRHALLTSHLGMTGLARAGAGRWLGKAQSRQPALGLEPGLDG